MKQKVTIEVEHEPVIGLAPIFNEEECIRGWANNIRLFTDRQFAIVDPRTSDDTVKILREECPWVNIWWQNVEAGDSVRGTWGRTGEITYIVEVNRFLHEAVPVWHWCLWLAGDERLDPRQAEQIRWAVDAATVNNTDTIRFQFYDMVTETTMLDYKNLKLNHKKFFMRSPRLLFNTSAHGGERGHYGMMKTDFAFYHFGNIAKNYGECWWHGWDGKNIKGVEEVPFEHPFVDWRNDGVEVKSD